MPGQSNSARVANSRLRIWLSESSWSTITNSGFRLASGSGSANSAGQPALSNRCRAFDFGAGAIERTMPVPPVSAASSASFPLPSSAAAPVPSRFCDSVPTTS